MRAGYLFSLFVSCALTGCVPQPPRTRPAALDKAAAEFKAVAASNRIAEAKKLARLLPGSPVHHVRVQGVAYSLFPRTEWIDGEHPSYMLSQQDLFKALGEPDRLASGWDLIPAGQVPYYPDRSVYRNWSLPVRPDRVYACYDVGRRSARRPTTSIDALVEEIGELPWADDRLPDPESAVLSSETRATSWPMPTPAA